MSRCDGCGAPAEACGCNPLTRAFEIIEARLVTEAEGEALNVIRAALEELEQRALSAEHAPAGYG